MTDVWAFWEQDLDPSPATRSLARIMGIWAQMEQLVRPPIDDDEVVDLLRDEAEMGEEY